MKAKYKMAILANEIQNDHQNWIKACEFFSSSIEYSVIHLTNNNWLNEIASENFDVLLAKPGGVTGKYKQLYDERIFILHNTLNYTIFPSPLEIYIYENKRLLSFWLKASKIPHPRTDVYYTINEAQRHIETSTFPIVAKTNIGASGSGVKILKNKAKAQKYLIETFLNKGAPQRIGPNIHKGGLINRGIKYLAHPRRISQKIKLYKTKKANLQRDFVIFQEYIPHKFEWRVVRIGNSFFAHKKIKSGHIASGTLQKNYDNPPLSLFDFAKRITDQYGLFSQAIDLFETDKNEYLVNEMQCIFGQSDPYQMLVDGIPGRYIYTKSTWKFEEGNYNENESFNLRVEYIVNYLDSIFNHS